MIKKIIFSILSLLLIYSVSFAAPAPSGTFFAVSGNMGNQYPIPTSNIFYNWTTGTTAISPTLNVNNLVVSGNIISSTLNIISSTANYAFFSSTANFLSDLPSRIVTDNYNNSVVLQSSLTVTGSLGSALIDTDGSILIQGTTLVGNQVPSVSSGTLMYFYPRKSAFRAGTTIDDEWGAGRVGNYSGGIGRAVIARGPHTFATGFASVASGDSSVAFGRSSAGGFAGFSAITGSGEGAYATSIGQGTYALPYNSFVIGRYNFASTGNPTVWVNTDPLFIIGNGTDQLTGSSNAVVVLKNGNFGIGENFPTQKLVVVGTINATAFTINGNPINNTSNYSLTSSTANYSYTSSTSNYAILSAFSGLSVTSDYSFLASTANYSTSSGTSSMTSTANFAITANFANTSTLATSALTSTTANYSSTANFATISLSSLVSTTANYSSTASFSLNSGASITATTANYSSTSNYSATSGSATSAITSSTSNYSLTSNYSVSAGSAASALTSTTANYTSTANYATSAGSVGSLGNGVVTNLNLVTGNFGAITGVGTISALTANSVVITGASVGGVLVSSTNGFLTTPLSAYPLYWDWTNKGLAVGTTNLGNAYFVVQDEAASQNSFYVGNATNRLFLDGFWDVTSSRTGMKLKNRNSGVNAASNIVLENDDASGRFQILTNSTARTTSVGTSNTLIQTTNGQLWLVTAVDPLILNDDTEVRGGLNVTGRVTMNSMNISSFPVGAVLVASINGNISASPTTDLTYNRANGYTGIKIPTPQFELQVRGTFGIGNNVDYTTISQSGTNQTIISGSGSSRSTRIDGKDLILKGSGSVTTGIQLNYDSTNAAATEINFYSDSEILTPYASITRESGANGHLRINNSGTGLIRMGDTVTADSFLTDYYGYSNSPTFSRAAIDWSRASMVSTNVSGSMTVTMSVSPPANGANFQRLTLIVANTGGSSTLTFSSNVSFSGTGPTVSANQTRVLEFIYDRSRSRYFGIF